LLLSKGGAFAAVSGGALYATIKKTPSFLNFFVWFLKSRNIYK